MTSSRLSHGDSFFGTRKRRKLGQHMLVSTEVARTLVDCVNIRKDDVVFEIGTGTGIVTEFAAQKAGKVVTCEIDESLLVQAKQRLSEFHNIRFVHGDAFEDPIRDEDFSICLTSLPYSRSRDFVEWICTRSCVPLRSTAAIVQKEFAKKICAIPKSDDYRAVSVEAQLSFEIQEVRQVGRECFLPPPNVDSVIITLTPRKDALEPLIDKEEIRLINRIFSFKGRLLRSALKDRYLSRRIGSNIPARLHSKRIEELSPEEFQSLIHDTK